MRGCRCNSFFSSAIVADCSSILRCSLRNSLSNIAFTWWYRTLYGFRSAPRTTRSELTFFDLFGHKPELRNAYRINFLLVTEGNRFSARSASLASFIGLISCLRRFEEVSVPSLLFELACRGNSPQGRVVRFRNSRNAIRFSPGYSTLRFQLPTKATPFRNARWSPAGTAGTIPALNGN
jgi:hypothetical protein